jgi:hypothetical protein
MWNSIYVICGFKFMVMNAINAIKTGKTLVPFEGVSKPNELPLRKTENEDVEIHNQIHLIHIG